MQGCSNKAPLNYKGMKKFFFLIAIAAFLLSCGSKSDTTVLNLATFNIRYDNPDDSLNNWRYRRDSVANYILSNNIDIVGMQEVLYSQLLDLRERLPEFDYVGVCRDDGDKAGEASPIFFRKERFDVLDSGTFWLSQYPDSVGFIGWDGACCRIATWAKLQDKQNEKEFMAINTHFDHVGVEARRNAALLILSKIKEIVGDKPAVLTGDFNVSDTSQAYRTITSDSFVLKDSHKFTPKRRGPAYSYHDWGRVEANLREKIDFIFVTPTINVLSSEVYQEHAVDTLKPETKWGFISDHNPVIAVLEF